MGGTVCVVIPGHTPALYHLALEHIIVTKLLMNGNPV